ncbi:hypothetical protein BOX15_Mlig009115g3 [Macrostomum lignano]|uniref:RING-type E3 ubiquitin transferase n=1 Tax=Macrostomum lignano TaxID=282301 RepID=A0A267G0I4_9PLAT|nr:hypothetical protein BOX15_Mlig009115g3 [Macrostomum lignano]
MASDGEQQQLVPAPDQLLHEAEGSAADDDANICRVCRMEAGQDRPLFYPCICTGTIKYIHQDCLLQWLQVSRREFCELCGHKYKFKPIYAPDMPSRLPLADILRSLLASAGRGLAFWFHYSLVTCSWLIAVPLLTCRLYRLLLQGGASGDAGWLANVMTLQDLITDCCLGGLATGTALLSYFCLVCLREAIGAAAPDWMRDDDDDDVDGDGNQAAAVHALVHQHNGDNHLLDAVNELHHGQQVVDDNPIANGEAPDQANGDGDGEGEGDDENVELNENNNQQNNNLLLGLQDLIMGAFGLEEAPANDDEAAQDAAGPAGGAVAGAQLDDLNWERLLGFDGSPTFVLWLAWVLGVNALFLLLFHYLPLRVGRALVRPATDYLLAAGSQGAEDAGRGNGSDGASGGGGSSSQVVVRLPYLADTVCTLAGYAVLAAALRLGHAVLSFFNSPRRFRRLAGTLYLVVKLCLLTALLLALCPLVCGLWLDLGSLRLLNSTLKDRRLAFDSVPGAFLLVHWLLGLLSMVYSVLFFCLFVRDAFRPGLFPAPEAEPNPLVRLVRMPWLATAFSTVACLAGFGCLSVLLLYMPARLLSVAVPGFLPYRVTYSSESDLSFIEFLLWQVAFPAMLDQGHVKASLQSAVHRAVRFAGSVSGLSDLLLARPGADPNPAVQPQPTPARLALFALSLAVCAVLGASVCLLCPVLIGRCLLRPFQLDSVNELYTAACGLYVCWALLSMGHLIADWLPWNRAQLLGLLRQWAQLLAKMLALGALYAAVAPLLLGVLFEKVVMIPLRLPDGCSPVLNLFHCWFTGLLLCKFITGCLFVGPNFRLKAALERLYEEGLARVPFVFIWRELYCPVLLFLGAPLAGPYLLLHGCLPLFVSDPRVLLEASRHLHFLATSTGAALALIGYEVRQFRRFYQHLVNDRYLVGQRLVNYHPD